MWGREGGVGLILGREEAGRPEEESCTAPQTAPASPPTHSLLYKSHRGSGGGPFNHLRDGRWATVQREPKQESGPSESLQQLGYRRIQRWPLPRPRQAWSQCRPQMKVYLGGRKDVPGLPGGTMKKL